MVERFKKEKLKLNDLRSVSGGADVDVSLETTCCKPVGSFKVLETKVDEWRQNGSPEKCKYCWHLKFNNGFYCDV